MPPLEHPNTSVPADGPEDELREAASPFAATTVASVFGSLRHEDPLSLEQMSAAIATEAKRRA